MAEPRSFAEFRDTGLLWLVNRVVFHPRGYALALHYGTDLSDCVGWSILGDGSEPWSFDLEGATEDSLFAAVKALLP